MPACATIARTDSHLISKYTTFEGASFSIQHEGYSQYLVRHEWQLHSRESILKITESELFEAFLNGGVGVKEVSIAILKEFLQTKGKMSAGNIQWRLRT